MQSDYKIGFSKFCELRPKWCITVNSSWTHCVCVCTYHQINHEDLIKLCVCAVEDHNRMFHLCTECPDKTELSSTLMTIFDSNDFDFDSTISYKQWVSTDRTTLVTLESTVNEFIDILTDKIFELCHHCFIKVQQAAYLKEAKAILDHETYIILMEFLENNIFLVQDAIQSFYWQNQLATPHPFAVYHNDDDGKLRCDCYCHIGSSTA